jgi:rod shape-determining protein MreD
VIRGLSALGLVRACAVVLAALLMVSLMARGIAPLPDLVLPLVVAGALLSGRSRGALLGLGAGWVVDLMPPGSPVLGSAALLYAAAGLLAGAGRREGETPMAWLALVVLAASAVVALGRVALAVLAAAPVGLGDVAVGWGLTATCAVVAVPLLVRAEHALVRRHLA